MYDTIKKFVLSNPDEYLEDLDEAEEELMELSDRIIPNLVINYLMNGLIKR